MTRESTGFGTSLYPSLYALVCRDAYANLFSMAKSLAFPAVTGREGSYRERWTFICLDGFWRVIECLFTGNLTAVRLCWCGKSEGPHEGRPPAEEVHKAMLAGSKGKARGQRRDSMLRHVKSFLATGGPLMLLFGLAVLLRFGVVLEMLR